MDNKTEHEQIIIAIERLIFVATNLSSFIGLLVVMFLYPPARSWDWLKSGHGIDVLLFFVGSMGGANLVGFYLRRGLPLFKVSLRANPKDTKCEPAQ